MSISRSVSPVTCQRVVTTDHLIAAALTPLSRVVCENNCHNESLAKKPVLPADGSLRALGEIVRAQLLPRSAREDYLKNALFTYGTATQTEGLEITVDHDEKGNIVHLNGRVSFESSPALRDRLLAMLRGPSPETVVVDLTKVSYFDSSGIATLIEALKIARNCKTSLCLKGLEGRLLHLFEVTGVSALFESSDCGNAFSGTKVS